MVASQFRAPVAKLLHPVYAFLVKLGVHPNMLTIIGLGLSIIAGWAIASKAYGVAAILIFVSGILDVLDGGVARVGGYASDGGAFLDSVADRIGESAIYVGLVLSFDEILYQLMASSILVLSYSVSYLRARGEGLGVSIAGIGVMERAERMSALFIACVFAVFFEQAFIYTLFIILILIFITVIHRFFRVYDALKLNAIKN
ncbi:MAG: CDP-alcohol phosphatidyltransferase family protein [Candidatus Heimdallarchaeota archaeon]|nr:CDP-alcohol phosphatidyltransferase family protein [Candidatus Heimdallarchaeota archaeon]MDH5645740.1 CDP-alcohol phosphatidyltransferase family protein [Candidatus Heimdallarchaeota archaeon]